MRRCIVTNKQAAFGLILKINLYTLIQTINIIETTTRQEHIRDNINLNVHRIYTQ